MKIETHYGNRWAMFSEEDIAALIRKEVGDEQFHIVQFIHSDGTVLNGWTRAQVMLERKDKDGER